MNPIIYAVPYDGEAKGLRLSYFYLHGEAEQMNGFDICNGNIAAFKHCLRVWHFDCTLVIGRKKYEAVCYTRLDGSHMCGYVVLKSDAQAHKDIERYIKELNSII